MIWVLIVSVYVASVAVAWYIDRETAKVTKRIEELERFLKEHDK